MLETLKKYWWIVLIVVVVIVAGAAFIIHNNKAAEETNEQPTETEANAIPEDYDPASEQEDYDNGIVFDEEAEGAELSFKKAEEADFIGKWEATSGQALYMYGNIDLDIRDGGKWSGNVAEEDLEGKWEFDGTTMSLTSELFDATLSFTEDGKLILQEDRAEDGILLNTVMTKK
jgi:hypothetical protein